MVSVDLENMQSIDVTSAFLASSRCHRQKMSGSRKRRRQPSSSNNSMKRNVSISSVVTILLVSWIAPDIKGLASAFVPPHHQHQASTSHPSSLKLRLSASSIVDEFSRQKDSSEDDDPDETNDNTSPLLDSYTNSRRRQGVVPRYSGEGLSRYYQSILSRTNDRQRFVTGQYPVIVTVEENPTRKWLALGRADTAATTTILVNGTSIDRSLASYDRYQWLDDQDRTELHDRYATVSLELLAEINMMKPGYVQILPSNGAGSSAAALRNVDSNTPLWNRWKRNSALYKELEDLEWESPYRDRLWVTGFTISPGRKGMLKSMDARNGHIDSVHDRTESMTLWPNEVSSVPQQLFDGASTASPADPEDALLVSDGFLVPGKDRGGIYLVKNPGHPTAEWTIRLTDTTDRWFYHKAAWVDLTGDGRKSILTARAKLRKEPTSTTGKVSAERESRPKNGQLVMLEMPRPHHVDEATGTPLEEDGTPFDPFSARHLPWKER